MDDSGMGGVQSACWRTLKYLPSLVNILVLWILPTAIPKCMLTVVRHIVEFYLLPFFGQNLWYV